MTKFHRRALIGGAMLAGSAAAAQTRIVPLADLRKEADTACLYHCDFGDHARFAQMLNNLGNHYSAYGADPFAVQLAIVTHSAGVKFFMETLEGTPWKDEVIGPDVLARVAGLAKNGLKVLLCDITFERLKLDRAKARKDGFISFVPSGVAAVAALQAKGFAYLKVG